MSDCSRPACNPLDGVERSLITVNRELPGPAIVVCKDGTIVVVVRNKMPAATTTVHWHGLFMHGEKGATIGEEEKNQKPPHGLMVHRVSLNALYYPVRLLNISL